MGLGISCVIWLAGAVAIMGLIQRMSHADRSRVYDANQSPTAEHRFGTTGAGEDVIDNLSWGLRQQALPLALALALCAAIIPAAMMGTIARLTSSPFVARCGITASTALDTLVELIESIPKLVIALACITLFTSDHLVLKTFLAMGVIYAPHLYRAIRTELSVIQGQVFLEAMRTTGVPLRRVILHNLLRNHCLHVVAVQCVLLIASIIHLDALLGYVGVRNRGEIYTWGSILGTGLEDFLQLRPIANSGFLFNDGVVWGPLFAVWLSIVVLFTLADALKIPLSGYVYRLR